MTYEDFKKCRAYYGFVNPGLTEEQFNHCREAGLSDDQIYNVGCDVSAGIDFDAAVHSNIYSVYEEG